MSKNNFVKILFVVLLLGILAFGSAFCDNLLDEARKLSWDTRNVEAIKTLFSNKTSIETFLKEAKPVLADIGASVGEYEITDLDNDGRLELVVTIDFTGRAIYNTIDIVQKVNDVFQTSSIWAPGINILDLRSRIVDLNHDRLKEILVPRLLAYPQFGTDPRPIINDVYEWDGAGYSKANVYFKDYYRSLLPRLKSELEAVRQGRKLDVPEHKALLEKKYEREIEEVNKILSE
jgi:hypothetical protein